jgi:hypothetical protein
MAYSFAPDVLKEVIDIARNFLRDYPKFFQVSFDAVGRTYELGSPNIIADNLWVATYTGGQTPVTVTSDTSASSFYSLDARNGIMRFNTTPPANSRIMIEGYYYEWVLPVDLEFYAKHAIHQHVYNLDVPLENMKDIILDTIGMAAVVETLWGLMTEFSRDIDVTTSESVHIPASQRFRMVQSLLEYWQRAYENQAKALNIGLNRIEMLNLRRVSRTTGFLVPIYKQRELGNYKPIERIFPEIGEGTISIEDDEDGDLRDEVIIQLEPQRGYSNIAPLGF